jgi:CHASE2 domain-containing sensor protein
MLRLLGAQAAARSSLARGALLARPAPALARRLATTDAVAAAPKGEKAVANEMAPEIDPETMSAFTGVPAGQLEMRVVKIYQQAQGVQNATQNTIPWRMQWEDDTTHRWTNPLMGWTSTSDPLSNTHMTLEFATAEDAVRFCEQNGAPARPIRRDAMRRAPPPPRAHARAPPPAARSCETTS